MKNIEGRVHTPPPATEWALADLGTVGEMPRGSEPGRIRLRTRPNCCIPCIGSRNASKSHRKSSVAAWGAQGLFQALERRSQQLE